MAFLETTFDKLKTFPKDFKFFFLQVISNEFSTNQNRSQENKG